MSAWDGGIAMALGMPSPANKRGRAMVSGAKTLEGGGFGFKSRCFALPVSMGPLPI